MRNLLIITLLGLINHGSASTELVFTLTQKLWTAAYSPSSGGSDKAALNYLLGKAIRETFETENKNGFVLKESSISLAENANSKVQATVSIVFEPSVADKSELMQFAYDTATNSPKFSLFKQVVGDYVITPPELPAFASATVTTQPTPVHTPVCKVSNEIKKDGQGINMVEFSDLNKQDDRVAIDFEYELGNNTMYCVKFDSLGNMKARKCYGDDGLPECLKNVCNGGKCLVKADGTEKCINCPSGFSGEFCSTPYSGSQCASLELLNPPETDRQFSTVKRLAKLEDGSTHRTMSWIDSAAGWFPDWTGTGSSLRHQWITIDLKSDMSIVGIAIQGSSDTYAAGTGWVSSFTVEYRIDGGSEDRRIYDYGIQKVFRNYPKFSSYGQYASVLFDEAVVGRYITIRTVSIEIYPAMRVGLLKCSD